jgi:hypothetical protein
MNAMRLVQAMEMELAYNYPLPLLCNGIHLLLLSSFVIAAFWGCHSLVIVASYYSRSF